MLQVLEKIRQNVSNFVKSLFADRKCSCCGGNDFTCMGMQSYSGPYLEVYVFKCNECGHREDVFY